MAYSVVATLLLKYDQFKKGAEDAAKIMKRTGNAMTTIGRDLTVSVSAPLALIGKQMAEVGSEFDLAAAKLRGLSGRENQIGVAALVAQARELGSTSIFTAKEVVNLQLSLRRLGKTDQEIKQLTPTILQFSQALDTDLATAGEFVVQTINRMDLTFGSFFDAASAARYAAEGFAFATANSALTVDGLRASLNYVGAEANAAGLSFSETAAILGTLADRGYTGSRAGTQLRRVFTELTKDGKDVSKEFFEIVRQGTSFSEALNVVGVRAAGVFSALGGTSDAILAFERAMRESVDVLGFFGEQMDDTLFASSQRVQSAFQELSISISEVLKPVLIAINSVLSTLLRGFSKLPEPIRLLGVAISAVLVALPPLIFLIGSLKKAIAEATLQTAAFGLALRTAIPVGGVLIAALSAIALAMGTIEDESESANLALQGVKDTINEIAKTGDREGAVQEALGQLDATEERIKNLTKALIQQERITRLAEEEADALDKGLRARAKQEKRVKTLQGVGEMSTPTILADLTEEEQEQIANARELQRARAAALQLTADELATQQKVADELRKYLAANQDIVDEINKRNKAEGDGLVTISDLRSEYERINGEITRVQNQFFANGGNVTEVQTKVDTLNKQLLELKNVFEALGVEVDPEKEDALGSKTIASVIEKYKSLNNEINQIRSSGDAIDLDNLSEQVEKLRDLEGLLKLLGVDLSTIEGTDAFKKLREQIEEADNQKVQDFKDAIKELNRELDNSYLEGTTLELAQLSQRFDDLKERLQPTEEQLNALNNIFAQMQQEIVKTGQEADEKLFKEESQAWFSEILSLTQGFADALVEVARGTQTFGQVVGQALLSVLKKVIALTVAYGVLNVLAGNGSAAANAVLAGQNLGSFLTGNLLGGLTAPTRSQGGLNVRGVVSGSDLVIANSRGVTALDRTYG